MVGLSAEEDWLKVEARNSDVKGTTRLLKGRAIFQGQLVFMCEFPFNMCSIPSCLQVSSNNVAVKCGPLSDCIPRGKPN